MKENEKLTVIRSIRVGLIVTAAVVKLKLRSCRIPEIYCRSHLWH